MRIGLFVVIRALASACLVTLGACSSAERTVIAQVSPTLPSGERATCDVGTMPTVPGTACAKVGPTSLPQGFEPSADGWGFHAIRPDAACSGATRAVIGETSCIPLDDC